MLHRTNPNKFRKRDASMPKAPNHVVPKKNATEEKLRATPFSGVEALDQEEQAIRLAIWRRLTEARVIDELLTKPEFKGVQEELSSGLVCSLSASLGEHLFRVSSGPRGLRLEVNKNVADSLGDNRGEFLQSLVKAGVESFGAIYLHAKGMASRAAGDRGEPDGTKGK
jgi:hypothetical protein